MADERVLNWPLIRTAYEQGSSLSALERQYSVSRQAIKKRANKEQWGTPVTPFVVTPVKQNAPNRDANAAIRVVEAIKLRSKKLTYQAIADQCGYADAASCHHAIQRELQRVIVENVKELRHEEVAMFDELHTAVWDQAINKDGGDTQYAAIDRILKISHARRELLGLNKPADEPAKPQIIIREVPAGWLKLPPAPVVEAPNA